MPTIIPKDDADRGRLAARLLAAAGDRPERVRTVTGGGTLAFEVDDDLAAAIGTADYVPEVEAEASKTEAESARSPNVKAATAAQSAKKATSRKTAARKTPPKTDAD